MLAGAAVGMPRNCCTLEYASSSLCPPAHTPTQGCAGQQDILLELALPVLSKSGFLGASHIVNCMPSGSQIFHMVYIQMLAAWSSSHQLLQDQNTCCIVGRVELGHDSFTRLCCLLELSNSLGRYQALGHI